MGYRSVSFQAIIATALFLCVSGCGGSPQALGNPQAEPSAPTSLRNILSQGVAEGTAYLLRMVDPEYGGAHKYYYADRDAFEDRLHAIYTASLIFTLLKVYDYTGDEALFAQARESSEFLLSMQHRDERSPRDGAFHHSLFLEPEERKEDRFVTGTTSKTIFTLLELSARTRDARYEEAARRGAGWLATMIREDGSVKPYVRKNEEGKWVSSQQTSTLYNGQTLSALSRTARATGEERYAEAAGPIAAYLMRKVANEGCYIGDDYRTPNPISSSWAVLSLIDFHRVRAQADVRDVIFRCSDDLVARQVTQGDPEDIGRWQGAFSSSGNGWIAEVLTEVHRFCIEERAENCASYRASALRGIPWIARHIYGDGNSDALPNAARARGGIFWSNNDPYVRTDSVSHGLNAFVALLGTEPSGLNALE